MRNPPLYFFIFRMRETLYAFSLQDCVYPFLIAHKLLFHYNFYLWKHETFLRISLVSTTAIHFQKKRLLMDFLLTFQSRLQSVHAQNARLPL